MDPLHQPYCVYLSALRISQYAQYTAIHVWWNSINILIFPFLKKQITNTKTACVQSITLYYLCYEVLTLETHVKNNEQSSFPQEFTTHNFNSVHVDCPSHKSVIV